MLLIYLLSLVALSSQQRDPLKDFCRLFGHQTTVVDRKHLIDGGLVNWAPITPNPLNYSNTWLRQGDLDENKDGFPSQITLSKNESAPSVHGGILWPDTANKLAYLYGGEFNGIPEDFRLWYYDMVYDTWNISTASTSDVLRASWGAGAVAQDKGLGFYYGGYLTNASVPGYSSETVLKNLLVYNMLDHSFTNITGPDDIPRAEGVMQYIPAGDAGLLVYFGGIEFPYDNNTARGVNMTDIFVFDIANSKWYQESANGTVPGNRRRFCAGTAWPDDRSSYNIYLFGGASIGNGTGYEDVYILSLPSFTWIKFWPLPEDEVGNRFPHHSLSCDVIDNSQMIIMGGTFPNTSGCDVPSIYGQHGLDLGRQNEDGAKWAMFNPNLTTYRVPTDIAKAIGGGPTGGATALSPAGDWENSDLKTQFAMAYTPGIRDATRPIPTATSAPAPSTSPVDHDSGGSNRGKVIGGAVGGTLGGVLAIAGVAGFLLYRRRQKKKREEEANRPVSELATHPMPPKSPELSGNAYAYPRDPGSPPPPSEPALSELGPSPEYQPLHHRTLSDGSFPGSSPPLSPETAHEMPLAHSPVSGPGSQYPGPDYHQHPPRDHGSPDPEKR